MAECNDVKTTGVSKQTLTNDASTYSTTTTSNGLCVVHGQGSSGPCVATATMSCKSISIVNLAPSPTASASSTTATGFVITGSGSVPLPSQTQSITTTHSLEMPAPIEPSAVPSGSADNNNNNNTNKDNLPAIIGGSVGGAVVLIAIVAFILVRRRRRMRKYGRDRYMVQVKGEPDLDEKLVGPQKQRHTGSNVSDSGFNGVAMSSFQQQQQQQQQQQRQHQQYERAMSPPIPPRTESRLSNNSGNLNSQTLRPGTPSSTLSYNNHGGGPGLGPRPGQAATKIDYTPRSTYIPATQKTNPNPRMVPPLSVPLHLQGTQSRSNSGQESTELYIDLIPVEETPKIASAILPEDPNANQAYHQMREEQISRSRSMGQNTGHGGNDGGGEYYSKALIDDDEEVNEDDIMYLPIK
ncbi:hypothetical protein BGX21_007331 [Mortierella sp. AD011]|nr:hypothetical protein BGX20_007361 [Mortierella sp. AD010]KAF9398744.1 hypothetical protein BGX21_007331 [Mortierella sp. AD011]